MSAKLTSQEEAHYGSSLSSTFIEAIASLTVQVGRFMQVESDGFYLEIQSEGIAVIHGDGWRAGFIKPYEEWYIFVPSYKDLN